MRLQQGAPLTGGATARLTTGTLSGFSVSPRANKLDVIFLFTALGSTFSLAWLMAKHRLSAPEPRHRLLAVLLFEASVAMMTWFCGAAIGDAVGAALVMSGLVALLAWPMKAYNIEGRLHVANVVAVKAVALLWGYSWIESLIQSPVLDAAFLVGFVLASTFIMWATASDLVGDLMKMASVIRRTWKRPVAPPRGTGRTVFPKISMHVPCYSEPPEVVMATLDTLARLTYPNFEVLVIDNNTKDPAMWQPLERHCEWLGERFRFFHVDPLAGAKAGALNFALEHTAENAVLVGVVDADYQVEADYLDRLIDFFDEPELAFIQTSHDYRDLGGRSYLDSCYWQYMPNYKLFLPGLSQWDAAHICGTMVVVRRSTLVDVGAWDETLLTEDSELAIRLHAAGHTGHYFSTTAGRGIIPETFEAYKKQRFRWCVGPIQQLRKHWRAFLPWPLGPRTGLTNFQRYIELRHSTENLPKALALVFWPVEIVFLCWLTTQDAIILPSVLVMVIALGIPSAVGASLFSYQILNRPVRDAVLGSISNMALDHTRAIATIAALCARRPLPWVRTSKFKQLPARPSALSAVWWEFGLGTASLAFAAVLAPLATWATPDLLVLGVFTLGFRGATYLAGPFLAVLAELELRAVSAEDYALDSSSPLGAG